MNDNIYLMPGDLFVSTTPVIFSTLLGSCVSVCLFDELRCFGGMNHYMLPDGTTVNMKGKFGSYAIPKLYEWMQAKGATRANMRASIFGGGQVVNYLSSASSDEHIGMKNTEYAVTTLKKLGIKVDRQDTGTLQGRKIKFQNWDNKIFLKYIQQNMGSSTIRDLAKNNGKQTSVLIVDDSTTVCLILKRAIEADAGLKLAGIANDAFQARDLLIEFNPDVILLDIVMPKLNGIQLLKKIMTHYPKPVIIISTIAKAGSKTYSEAQSAGAYAVFDKNELEIYSGLDRIKNKLIPMIKMAAASAHNYIKKNDIKS